jgi:tetratricopeptide (TPR) repeat protein
MNKKLIKLTEQDLHRIVKQSVNKILKESSWADGAEMTYAYHWLTLGASEEQQDADAAYHLYDLLSHNEYNVDEAIKYIQKYGYEDSAMEQEAIPRDSHIFGRSSDGKYILTYDTHTGAFDVWESSSMKESKTRRKKAAKALNEAQVTLSPSHEARLRTVVGELAQQIGSILRKLTMYDRGMNNYLADLVQNEKWVDDLYGVYYSMKEFAEATPQVDASAQV